MLKISFLQISTALRKFKFHDDYDFIVGIANGGIVPAILVAEKLQLELSFININYRDIDNQPKYLKPKISNLGVIPRVVKNILLVDDVSVSGKTLVAAKSKLKKYNLSTFVLKGEADYALFPKLKECVDWPWAK